MTAALIQAFDQGGFCQRNSFEVGVNGKAGLRLQTGRRFDLCLDQVIGLMQACV